MSVNPRPDPSPVTHQPHHPHLGRNAITNHKSNDSLISTAPLHHRPSLSLPPQPWRASNGRLWISGHQEAKVAAVVA